MTRPIQIAPSLLAADFARLADEIARVEAGGADVLHIDVMDGHFVPNLTIGPPVVEAIKRVATRPLDVHLMMVEPWRYGTRFLDAGADTLTFHVERARDDVESSRELIGTIRDRGARAGLAINPDGDPAWLEPWYGQIDQVLVMSVFPGFGGQSFIEETLATTRAVRARFDGDIEMDGGIGPDTIARCAEAGANVFVAGTAVFGAPDVAVRIAELRRSASGGG